MKLWRTCCCATSWQTPWCHLGSLKSATVGESTSHELAKLHSEVFFLCSEPYQHTLASLFLAINIWERSQFSLSRDWSPKYLGIQTRWPMIFESHQQNLRCSIFHDSWNQALHCDIIIKYGNLVHFQEPVLLYTPPWLTCYLFLCPPGAW